MWAFILGIAPYTKLQNSFVLLSWGLGAVGALALSRLFTARHPDMPFANKLAAIVTILAIGDVVFMSAVYNFTN